MNSEDTPRDKDAEKREKIAAHLDMLNKINESGKRLETMQNEKFGSFEELRKRLTNP